MRGREGELNSDVEESSMSGVVEGLVGLSKAEMGGRSYVD